MNLGIRVAIVRAFWRAALPLASYYAVTLVLPLANGAARAGDAFVEHAVVVLVVPPFLIVVACITHGMARGLLLACRQISCGIRESLSRYSSCKVCRLHLHSPLLRDCPRASTIPRGHP